MKETFDDITRNENIPLPTTKPSNVDHLILDHHHTALRLDPLYDFHDSLAEEETDDGFEDELSDSHQEKMRYKIEELNAQLAADPTPVESNRQRRVTFKENLVDIMDSHSPQHSPDFLGDEDINEKSLEEIQMLSQKPFLEELSDPGGNSIEYPTIEKDYSEQEHESEKPSENNYAELVENLELEALDLNETETGNNEIKDVTNEINNEDSIDERSRSFDGVKHCSEEVPCSEMDTDVVIEVIYNDTKNLLNESCPNENVDNILNEATSIEVSHDTHIDELQHDISCIEPENSDTINLCLSSSSSKNVNEQIDDDIQSDFISNTDELLVKEAGAEIDQSTNYSKDLDEKETEHLEEILELQNQLEQNRNYIDCDISGNSISNFSNIDEEIPEKKSLLESCQTNVENISYKENKEKVLVAGQSIKLTDEYNEQLISSDKPETEISVETKTTKISKSKSKLKSVKSAESQPYKKLPNYKGNPRSQYGLSKEECKDLMHSRKEKISQLKMREKEEEESRIQKQEEARKAFAAWLSKKKMQDRNKNKKITKVASINEVPTKEERRKEYGDTEEAFQTWLKKKEQQISREEILKQLEEEEKALNQCRVSRREATKAFNRWLARKQKDQRQIGRRCTQRGDYLNTLPLQARHIEAFAQTFHAYLGNTM